jgi:hypothetical protein
MKRSLPWVAASILLAFAVCGLLLSGCSRGQQSLSDEEAYQRFLGTWENTEIQISQPFGKAVLQPDYVMKLWVRKDSPSAYAATVTVKKTWVDAEGGTCCQYFFTFFERTKGQGLGLMRLDKARKVLELNQKYGKEDDVHPDRIERKSPGENWTLYMIFYRK